MDHPNIAKVLDAGTTETGRPYFVMELVKGIPITDYFEQEGTEVTEKLKLFIRVCQAIQHAHQKGIIHRDIKPSNVMVTLHDGEPVPKVIDFGIAKATQGDLTDKTIYTQYNQFIGTPAYMSPEQAEMSGLDIDTRSDVYSLGVLLYEILTGSTPFDSKELMASGIDEMRKIIRERDPVKPSTRLSQTVDLSNGEFDRKPPEVRLPVDLDWIALKCLEKDRSRRYDTANGLCLDIQRHLNNELVEARPPSVAYRISVGWRRNRVIGSAAILSLAAILIGLSIAVGMYFRERAARTTADNLREKEGQARATAQAAAREAKLSEQRAVESGQKERLQRYVSDMRLAQAALNSENLGLARGLLDKHRPSQTGQDLRGWEWRWLWKQIRSDSLYSLYQGEERIQSLSVSPNGRWVGFFEDDRRPQFWDLRRRKEMTLPLGDAEVQAATFSSADSNLVLLTRKSELQFVQSWDLESLRLVSERRVPLEINDFRLSKDGRRLIGRRDWGGSMHVVDLASDSPFTTYDIVRSRGDNAGVFWAISPAGDRVAQASDSWVVLHSLETGEELWRREATTDRFVTAVEFSPNGENLVTGHGYVEGAIRLWNAGTGDLIDTLEGHRFWVSDLEFTDGGETLISCSGDQSLRVQTSLKPQFSVEAKSRFNSPTIAG